MALPDAVPRLRHGPVVLRAFEERDADLVISAASDDLIPSITTVPTGGSRRDAVEYIARQHSPLRSGAGYSFAIADTETDVAVGQIGLWLRDIDEARATTGYWIGPGHRRRGYLTAALRALTDWALGWDEIERLQLFVEPWNEGSWRAAERCGYQREGLLRSWQQVGQQRKDMLVYSRPSRCPPTPHERLSGSSSCRAPDRSGRPRNCGSTVASPCSSTPRRYPDDMPEIAMTPETLALRELLDAHRDEFLAILDRYGATSPKLFGSVARGTAHPGSDIDILVEMDPAAGNLLMRASGLMEETRALFGRDDIDVFPVQLLKQPISASALIDAVAL